MGLFRLIKQAIELNKEIKKVLKDHERYVNMSDEEVNGLNDEEFYDAVYERIGEKVEQADSLDGLNKYQLSFFVLHEFDIDLKNGGLCQYLCNSVEKKLENVEYCLKVMNFNKIAELYSRFIYDNNIDFSVFDDEEFDYEEFSEEYDFYRFDDKYYEIYKNEPIYDVLLKFARENYDVLA